MKRLVTLAALTLAVFCGPTSTPVAQADAGCDAVVADLPVLTDNISTEWVTQDCNPNYQVRVTLSEFTNDDWNRADCGGGVNNCTRVLPKPDDNANCDPFWCSDTSHHDVESWNQNGGPCSRLWRTKVVVTRPNGDVIAQDISPANTC